MFDRYDETIVFKHKLGEKIIEQELTIPRRRPFRNVLQFHFALRETDPTIWRSIHIPENYTFYDFHVAIQDAMLWWDYHLHNFDVPGRSSHFNDVHIECPWIEPWEIQDGWLLTTEAKLQDYFSQPGDRAFYHYDYGDSWVMDVSLEKIIPREKGRRYPICWDGALAAPPEDCGGTPGYERCKKMVQTVHNLDIESMNRMDEDDKELLIWLGDWDPDKFEPEKIVFENPRQRFKKALSG